MLVLSRRVSESLVIGDEIEIEILDISGTQVKLGIRAPRQIPVRRGELAWTIRQNQIAAEPVSDQLVNQVRKSLK